MVITIFGSVREMDPYTHFTQFSVASFHLLVYAFFTMTMFAAMYYIVPRLVGCEWLSASFIRLHFWGAGYGIGFMILLLIIAGFVQGGCWNDPVELPASRPASSSEIMPYLRGRTLAWMPLIVAHCCSSSISLQCCCGWASRAESRRSLRRSRKETTSLEESGSHLQRHRWQFSRCHSRCWRWCRRSSLAGLQPLVNEDTGDIYPIDVAGRRGGGAGGLCIPRMRGLPYGAGARRQAMERILHRGWGVRRTVARDYIYEKPLLLGYMRFGPDLANIGTRKDKDNPDKYSAAWHYLHLYDPELTSPGSIMPSYKFLFEKRKIVGQMDAEALKLTGDEAPPPGYQIVPSRRGAAVGGLSDHAGPQPSAAGSRSEHPAAEAAGVLEAQRK